MAKYYSYKGEISVIDRSNPHDIVVIYPKGHKEFPEGKSMTRIEEMRHLQAKNGFWYGRIDCLHMYLDIVETTIDDKGNKTEKSQQVFNHFIDMDINGKLCCDASLHRYIPSAIKTELGKIRMRIFEASKKYPEMLKYLRKAKD